MDEFFDGLLRDPFQQDDRVAGEAFDEPQVPVPVDFLQQDDRVAGEALDDAAVKKIVDQFKFVEGKYVIRTGYQSRGCGLRSASFDPFPPKCFLYAPKSEGRDLVGPFRSRMEIVQEIRNEHQQPDAYIRSNYNKFLQVDHPQSQTVARDLLAATENPMEDSTKNLAHAITRLVPKEVSRNDSGVPEPGSSGIRNQPTVTHTIPAEIVRGVQGVPPSDGGPDATHPGLPTSSTSPPLRDMVTGGMPHTLTLEEADAPIPGTISPSPSKADHASGPGQEIRNASQLAPRRPSRSAEKRPAADSLSHKELFGQAAKRRRLGAEAVTSPPNSPYQPDSEAPIRGVEEPPLGEGQASQGQSPMIPPATASLNPEHAAVISEETPPIASPLFVDGSGRQASPPPRPAVIPVPNRDHHVEAENMEGQSGQRQVPQNDDWTAESSVVAMVLARGYRHSPMSCHDLLLCAVYFPRLLEKGVLRPDGTLSGSPNARDYNMNPAEVKAYCTFACHMCPSVLNDMVQPNSEFHVLLSGGWFPALKIAFETSKVNGEEFLGILWYSHFGSPPVWLQYLFLATRFDINCSFLSAWPTDDDLVALVIECVRRYPAKKDGILHNLQRNANLGFYSESVVARALVVA